MCSSSGGQIVLYSLWYNHTYRWPSRAQIVQGMATYRCDYTRGCVVQFWPPDDEHMCSNHVEAWNKSIIKFSASSWLVLRNKAILGIASPPLESFKFKNSKIHKFDKHKIAELWYESCVIVGTFKCKLPAVYVLYAHICLDPVWSEGIWYKWSVWSVRCLAV